MKIFPLWLKSKVGVIGWTGGFCAVFAAVFALYRLPLRAVAYPAALCAVLGLCLLAADWSRTLRLHRLLRQIRDADDVILAELPAPSSPEERDLREILALLARQQKDALALQSAHYRDRMEYYTVWAHQIKTPIAAMKLRLQQADSPLARQLSADLLRVEQYVEMAMNFLRLDSGVNDFVIAEYPLAPIVRQAVKRFSGEFILKGLRLELAPISLTAVTDEKWLGFVIEQLLSNALKYTPSGSVTVAQEEPGTLLIRDTGIGIDPADLPLVTERGYTGENGRLDRGASGIGLFLCREICRRLGHGLTLESVPGRGTTVRLTFRRPSAGPE